MSRLQIKIIIQLDLGGRHNDIVSQRHLYIISNCNYGIC
jgi:hypothetical protein